MLCALLALCLIFGITGFNNLKTVHAETKSGTSGGVKWEYDTETCTFTVSRDGNGYMADYGSYGATPWEDAGVPEDGIKKIVVNEGVEKIGNNAFEDCGGVREISLPKSLREVGHNAFDCVGEDHKNDIPIGTVTLKVVGTDAFIDSYITGQIIMCEGWKRLNDDAFTRSRITSVCICKPSSDGFDWLDGAFQSCKQLTDVTICEDLSYVAGGTFSGCENLKSIEFPKAMRNVYNNAFDGCNAIRDLYCRGSFSNIWFQDESEYIAHGNYNLYENWVPTYVDGNESPCECEVGKYQILAPSCSTLDGNWWIVRSKYEINHTIEVTENSTIVLLDNCDLTVSGGIHVHPNKSLYIVSEQVNNADQMGSLKVASVPDFCAGIGAGNSEGGVDVFICGGKIEAHGGFQGAGIGCGYMGNANVTIYNGNVKAYGDIDAAGIGCGLDSKTTVTIYNGTIEAHGRSGGAGIGCGENGESTVTIYNGNIKAWGEYTAGIGCGEGRGCICTVNLYGGNIEAHGSDGADDIGNGPSSYATVNDYRNGTGTGTLITEGSLAILLGVLAGVFIITSGVFIYLYFNKNKKKKEN